MSFFARFLVKQYILFRLASRLRHHFVAITRFVRAIIANGYTFLHRAHQQGLPLLIFALAIEAWRLFRAVLLLHSAPFFLPPWIVAIGGLYGRSSCPFRLLSLRKSSAPGRRFGFGKSHFCRGSVLALLIFMALPTPTHGALVSLCSSMRWRE